MSARIIACRARDDYTLWCKFSDGLQGTVNLEPMLDIGCFKFWRDVRVFLTARPHPETGGAWWPFAGVHLDREILYKDLEARGARPAQPARDKAFQQFLERACKRLDGAP
jgi:hypothetical protein